MLNILTHKITRHTAFALTVIAAASCAQDAPKTSQKTEASMTAVQTILSADGTALGELSLEDLGEKGTKVTVSVKNISPGAHAMHFHEDGTGTFIVVNERVSINGDHGLPALLDADGTALILHAGEDDYISQPTGAAGGRIGCAVIGG